MNPGCFIIRQCLFVSIRGRNCTATCQMTTLHVTLVLNLSKYSLTVLHLAPVACFILDVTAM